MAFKKTIWHIRSGSYRPEDMQMEIKKSAVL